MAQYVYTMNRVGKIVPPKRQILKDISLSFFPGAKIGVLGLNGSGKSTLLQDHGRRRQGDRGRSGADAGPEDRLPAAGAAARPRADRARGGRGGHRRRARGQEAARRGLRRLRRARRRLRQARRRAGRARGDHRRRRQREHRACSWRSPPTRCACRRGTRRSASCRAARSAASRCAGCCCPSPTCCCSTSRPTTSTPNRSTGSSSSCSAFPAPWSAITHDRYFLDNAAEWILELDRGRGIPWKGNYSSWLEQKEERLEQEQKHRGRAHQGDEEGARVGAPEPEGRARPRARRAWRASRSCPTYEYQKRNETQEIFIPVAERLGNEVIEFDERQQGLRRPAADRQPELQGAGRARSSASSARTAPASRRCSA